MESPRLIGRGQPLRSPSWFLTSEEGGIEMADLIYQENRKDPDFCP